MQCLAIVCLFTPSAALLLAPASVRPAVAPPRAAARMQSLDYNDPMVAKEFGSIQGLDLDDVTDELAAGGIVAPATMNDMEIRMMLVEVRMRKAGTFGGATKPKKQAKPASFANEFERVMFEKPAVKELYATWQQAKNINAMNLAAEHINNPKRAKDRYAGTPNYDATIAELDAAMNAKVVKTVDTARLMFSGFPSNMGEQGVKMTLQARARRLVPSRERLLARGTLDPRFGPVAQVFGEMKEFSCEESDDGMSLNGKCEYEDVAAAKSAVDKYDGQDMGLGTTLELESY